MLYEFFTAAFQDGHVFPTEDGEVTVRPAKAGDLVLTSGRIILADPGWLSHSVTRRPLARPLSPGRYPVWLSLARSEHGGERDYVECVRLVLSDRETVRWEPGYWEGDDPASLKPGARFCYFVETASACFVDADLVRAPDQAERLQAQLAGLPETGSGSADVLIDPETGANAIVFETGWGDGSSPFWWGLDTAGEATCLVTEFGLMDAVEEWRSNREWEEEEEGED